MFTGLVHSVGKIHSRGKSLQVEGCGVFEPLLCGDSVAVDGVCLTVKELIPNGFLADVSEETLKRTTLGEKSLRGGLVNLEPALRFSDRLGGHLVTGHVDGLGKLVNIDQLKNSWNVEVICKSANLGKYICEKGSITLNGISLTIAKCSENGSQFAIAFIPHTWDQTSMKYLEKGELVNLEVDLLAKYAEKLLGNISNQQNSLNNKEKAFSEEWLKDNGW